MKLQLLEDHPGEASEVGALAKVDIAYQGLLGLMKATLPPLPLAGEVKAVRELADVLSDVYARHASGLQARITAAIRDAATGQE